MNKFRDFYHKHPRWTYAIAVAALLLIGLAVWLAVNRESSDGLPKAETPADTGALRLSLLPTAECLPLYVADAAGIFDSLGLDVVIADRRAQFDADTALYGHSAHVAATDLVRLHYQTTRGHKATILAGLQGAWGVVVAPGQRTTDIKALKDRLLGMSRYSQSDFFGYQALQSGELEYGDMLRAQINDFGVRANMVLAAQTEAAVLPEPYLKWALSQKARTLWTAKEGDANIGCLAAQPSVLTSKRRSAQVELLFKGYNLAVKRIAKRGLQGCDSIIARRFDLPLETIQKLKLPRYRSAALPSALAIERSRTFLSQRGVALSGSLLMDDRYIKK